MCIKYQSYLVLPLDGVDILGPVPLVLDGPAPRSLHSLGNGCVTPTLTVGDCDLLDQDYAKLARRSGGTNS